MNKPLVAKKYTEREIITDIIDYINDNALPVDTMIAPSSELASRYNVCVMTINRAMNKLVKKGILYRVRGRGTFVAARQSISETYNICIFFWPGQMQSFDETNFAAYGTYSDYLINKLQQMKHNVSTYYDPAYLLKANNTGELKTYDGIILPAGMVDDETLPILQAFDGPVIMTQDDTVSDYPFHQVIIDYTIGYTKALDYIKSKGHSKIVVLVAGENTTSLSRYQKLKNLVEQKGLAINYLMENTKDVVHNTLLILLGRSLGKAYLKKRPEGAIFSLSDLISFGFIDVMNDNNIKLGTDIDFVSYDNLEGRGLTPFGAPVITSIEHPLLEAARETMNLLIEGLQSSSNVSKIIRVPSEKFVIRDTA